MTNYPHSMLDEYKTQASILLKRVRAKDTKAVNRFYQLPYVPKQIKLKHALHVVAYEQGYDSWAELKQSLERAERHQRYFQSKFTPLCPARCRHFTNEWHTDYDVALSALEITGGYLLPYKGQFFICQSLYISTLGLDPEDPDWERIGWNWVQPKDQEAWERLNTKLTKLNNKESGC